MPPLKKHSLCAEDAPYVFIRFHCYKQKKERDFYSCVNSLSGSRLSAFGSDAPSIGNEMAEICSILKGIKNKSEGIIEVIVKGKKFQDALK